MQKTAFLFPGQGSQSVGMMTGIAGHSGVVEQTLKRLQASSATICGPLPGMDRLSGSDRLKLPSRRCWLRALRRGVFGRNWVVLTRTFWPVTASVNIRRW